MWFIAVEVQQETSAPSPKKNPGSTPDVGQQLKRVLKKLEKLATIESELSEISAKHVEECQSLRSGRWTRPKTEDKQSGKENYRIG